MALPLDLKPFPVHVTRQLEPKGQVSRKGGRAEKYGRSHCRVARKGENHQ